jgi:inner membrane protein
LLVCLLVLAMGVPLIIVGGLVGERQTRANQVTSELGLANGGPQVVGGPMLLVPFTRQVDVTNAEGRIEHRTERGNTLIFAKTGSANAALAVEERHRGIYRAAGYTATVNFDAAFDPADAISNVDPSAHLDWSAARIVLVVRDSRAIRDAAQLRFADGSTAMLEPLSDLRPVTTASGPDPGRPYVDPNISALQAFAAPAPITGPTAFNVATRLTLGGAQRFAVAAFAQDTSVTISGDRDDVSAEGYFQPNAALQPSNRHFEASWRIPYVARGIEKAADLGGFDLGQAAQRDMAVSFVSSDDIYRGVARAVAYGIMFIGIVFLATLIFEAVSGRKAHPAQYILVGLAQCVFYLLLLSMTEIIGFTVSFTIAAAATVGLLGYYAGASFKSAAVGVRATIGLALLYAAMYVLMTLEDFALLAGSIVAFVVIAATMIATRRIDWYGRGVSQATSE